MTIKTNLNRLNHFHDNVNDAPIEKQILDLIVETKVFKEVKYETKQSFRCYVINDNAILQLEIKQDHFTLAFHGDKFKLCNRYNSTFHGMKFESDFKNEFKNEFVKYLKAVYVVIKKTNEAQVIANEILNKKKEYEKNINTALDKYFSNDIIKPRYAIFDENLIPHYDTEYTAGIWSWLNFDIKGTKQPHSKHEKCVGVELYMDGTIKYPRIDNFIKAIQCDGDECKPSLKEMQKKLSSISKLEEKVKKFNGTKIPYLKDILAVKKKGYEFRKSIKF